MALHLFDHVTRCSAHGLDGHRRKQEGQHCTHEQTSHHTGTGNVNGIDTCHAHVRSEQCEGSQRRGANGEALADGGSGVTHRIEAIGAGAHFLRQLAHLGDAAGVIGDGSVGVHGELDAGVSQHTHRGNRDAVQAGKVIRPEDGGCEKQDRPHCRTHTHPKAGDNVRGCAALGRLTGDLPHRFFVKAGIIFGNKPNAQPASEAD